jgi:hypothetical protein
MDRLSEEAAGINETVYFEALVYYFLQDERKGCALWVQRLVRRHPFVAFHIIKIKLVCGCIFMQGKIIKCRPYLLMDLSPS